MRTRTLRKGILLDVITPKNKKPTMTWIKNLFIEIYIGEQIIDMLTTTAPYNNEQYIPVIDSEPGGWRKPIKEFIPATLTNKIAEKSISRMIKEKYLDHYEIIKPATLSADLKKEGCYELNHGKIHLLTELKIAYNTIWTIINISIDLAIYLSTNSLTAALISGATIEALRRIKI